MLTIARVQPQHHVLEPSAGAGDLASAIASIGVSNLDCFESKSSFFKAKFLKLNLKILPPYYSFLFDRFLDIFP